MGITLDLDPKISLDIILTVSLFLQLLLEYRRFNGGIGSPGGCGNTR